MRLTIISVLILAALASGCGADKKSDASKQSSAKKNGSNAEDRKTPAQLDAEAEESLNEKGKTAEAKAWLKKNNSALWKGDLPRVRKLIDEFYSAGAPTVTAVGIESAGDSNICAMFIVTLPADAAARKKCFDLEKAFWKEYDADEDVSSTDNGQKYIEVNLDQ